MISQQKTRWIRKGNQKNTSRYPCHEEGALWYWTVLKTRTLYIPIPIEQIGSESKIIRNKYITIYTQRRPVIPKVLHHSILLQMTYSSIHTSHIPSCGHRQLMTVFKCIFIKDSPFKICEGKF